MVELTELKAGTQILYGGNKVTAVSKDLAAAFQEGDRLIVVQDTGDLLHIPGEDWNLASEAVTRAVDAFADVRSADADQIDGFFLRFAELLEDDGSFAPIATANAEDVQASRDAGRTATRLILDERMRQGMIEGLRGWAAMPSMTNDPLHRLDHDGWSLELNRAPLGVVGFVFEGRPNVLADGAGVLKGGNTTVLRIGSAAYATASAVFEHAIRPALREVGLPEGSVSLVETRSRASGWAMFSDKRLGLAVARGSGAAVGQLGAVARQSGVAVSLHGTGGAWVVVGESADPDLVKAVTVASLDRKVCNTLNTLCLPRSRASELAPVVLDGLEEAGQRRQTNPKLHYTADLDSMIPDRWRLPVEISRARGSVTEPKAELIDGSRLGDEWEWEDSPEMTLTSVESVEEAVSLFNTQSPRFIASLISEDAAEHDRFYATVDAPFVGNGMTRWVDGQYALNKPELGLSNWQAGRLMMRGGILSADSVFTVRARATQTKPGLHR